jgi:hypothetical protein
LQLEKLAILNYYQLPKQPQVELSKSQATMIREKAFPEENDLFSFARCLCVLRLKRIDTAKAWYATTTKKQVHFGWNAVTRLLARIIARNL